MNNPGLERRSELRKLPEMTQASDRHNEGSCELCTGWHDADEAAFMNRRRPMTPEERQSYENGDYV